METEIVLGTDATSGSPVSLGLRERQQGTYIIGKPGTGKTTLIEHMVVQDIVHGLGVCVLDPHGDLIDAILTRIPETREGDVILLDAGDLEFPFGVNLFECRDLSDRALVGRVATQAVEVFEKIWGETSWGPQLAQVLRNCAYTMVENQGYTLTEIRRLLTDDEFRARLVANLTLRQAREFWELEYNPLPKREQLQRVSSTLNKVDEFLTPAIQPIVGFGRTTVDFRQAMDEGKVVLVKLPVGHLGSAPVALLGSIIVAQIFNAALSRQDVPPEARRQFNLFADEYHRFATPTFADLLTEARKYGLATTLAHQFRDQLDTVNQGATLASANLIVFGVSGDDAVELAQEFDRTPPPPSVIGQRRRLSPSLHPLRYLLERQHEDDHVNRIVAEHLRQWDQSILAPSDRPSGLADANFGEPRIRADAVRPLNNYLVATMTGRVNLGSPEEADLLWDILTAWPKLADRSAEGMSGATLLIIAHDSIRLWCAANLNDFEAEWNEGIWKPFLAEKYSVSRPQRSRYDFDVWSLQHPDVRDARRISSALSWLHDLARRLALKPILVDDGEWEPIYDHIRTYSDVEAEIASELVNLPKFRARTKLLMSTNLVEAALRVAERPPSDGAHKTQPLGGFAERARRDYCEPVDKVLDRMAKRVDGTSLTDEAHARRVRL